MVAPFVEENNPSFSLQVKVHRSSRSSSARMKIKTASSYILKKKATFGNRLEKLWRWGEVSLPQKAFEFIQKRDGIKKHQRVLAKNENKISIKRQKTLAFTLARLSFTLGENDLLINNISCRCSNSDDTSSSLTLRSRQSFRQNSRQFSRERNFISSTTVVKAS